MLSTKELISVVANDLRFLRQDWDESVDDHSLRRASPVLRRLLVDCELQRAWKAAGFQREPQIVASTIDPILRQISEDTIVLASAGGAKYGGMELRGVVEVAYVMSPEEMERLRVEGLPEVTLGLRAFCQAPCLIIKGVRISRHSLVKFVANYLGGAHASAAPTKGREQRLYALLDEARRTYRLLEKPVVYFELLAAGQALAKAADIDRFLHTAVSHEAA